MRVDAQTNEHQAALELLDILARRSEGHVITGDAAFCQREICEKIIGRGDDYLLTVKDNQPSLVTDIDAGLSDAETARTFSPHRSYPALGSPPGTAILRQDRREESGSD
jgi:predicted transposase YbfD/YdcC